MDSTPILDLRNDPVRLMNALEKRAVMEGVKDSLMEQGYAIGKEEEEFLMAWVEILMMRARRIA